MTFVKSCYYLLLMITERVAKVRLTGLNRAKQSQYPYTGNNIINIPLQAYKIDDTSYVQNVF